MKAKHIELIGEQGYTTEEAMAILHDGASLRPEQEGADVGISSPIIPYDQIITGDCEQVLAGLPPGTARLTFADVPFNIGLDYPGYEDTMPAAEYLAKMEACFRGVQRVLTPDGSLFVAIGPQYQAELLVLLKGLGFHWRNSIIWHYTFGPCQQRKFTPSWTAIHYLTMDPTSFTFNWEAVAVPSARQLVYHDRRAQAKGKTPDDVWVLRPQTGEHFFTPKTDVWHVPRVAGTFRERLDHVCQMPLDLLTRIVRVASNPGDLVLDPVAGTGTTLVAAARENRRYLGIELDEQTAALARARLAQELQPTVG
jgi:site-specific DNA-methyltransferase (adenine-specific)